MPSSLQFYRYTTARPSAAFNPKTHFVSQPCALTDHKHAVASDQCSSVVVQTIDAPVALVWSLVRRFDNPQMYKQFLKSCRIVDGDGVSVGTIREVHVVSGLPALSSRERLEILDDEKHVLSFSIVGGEHRLKNYRSVTSLHVSPGGGGTVVVESYVVDVPPGNTKEETCVFVNTIVRCNLQSLARESENIAKAKIKNM
ncbi:abscisic acid receptor PYL4-like [Cucurbita pepo subsp. pepo]|uniref:abscisic acid receptor PYL4-like n=1 Tax=Cucurbita pepo subsp. pepo TaxID=3664 RepID=UPI000C9DA604|nr:abscisic acid receptor PYL4-like [Cucurbita pepo subsp. pepo]XP_023535875.1 abscisic acid receptor PYL4-like [Cucurbita pepo subsp. pepo]